MTGQVCFQVIHNASKPFRVVARGQTIEDIGTEFDVNAYDDEPAVKTTLISGSASVSTVNHTELLHQGVQAIVMNGESTIKLRNNIDTDLILAWRKGKFKFEEADIQSVMRQLARWYDIDIVYQGKVSSDSFNGGTFRNESLQEVLKVLELNGGVHFKLEGKKVIVLP
jgi:ferric-dicitrate binding protein FerR (iron transport regulator)